MFQGRFKGVYRKFQGCSERVFQGSFKSVSRKFRQVLKTDKQTILYGRLLEI